MTKKVIYIGDKKRSLGLSNEAGFERILSSFNVISLKDDAGVDIMDFQSLEPGQTYTLGEPRPQTVAAYHPASPPNKTTSTPKEIPRLPPSPPRNGISRADFVLAREHLVSDIIDRARPIVIIRSPPATGKTSLLDLTENALSQRDDTRIVRIRISDDNGILEKLEGFLGVSLSVGVGVESLPGDTWILIDDAQLAFRAANFWKVVIKDLESSHSKRIHVVITATYDLASQGTTPYLFAEYPHVCDLMLTPEESESLYDGFMNKVFFTEGWMGFKDTLLKLAGGHVGVLTGGISMVHRIYSDSGKRILESDALDGLRDDRFRVNLNRCFPCQKLMNDAQREAVGQTIVSGPRSVHINASQGSSDNPALVQLVRAGVLSSNCTFSCLVAQWQYFNYFFNRPAEGPESIEDLILQAVGSMSALRLRQSCNGDNFPKEAALQQLFNEAFTMQLPPSVAVFPDLNTFAKDSAGKTVTGELDFYISGNLDWAIEVLRNGDKINEHVKRFDPTNGKYRSVGHKAHLVVDCRGPRTKAVETMQDRCTLYFDHNFAKVECKMRERPLEIICLGD